MLVHSITGHSGKLAVRCAHPTAVEVDAIVYHIAQSKKPATQDRVATTRNAPAPKTHPKNRGAKSNDNIVCGGILLKVLKMSAENLWIKVCHGSRRFGIDMASHSNGVREGWVCITESSQVEYELREM